MVASQDRELEEELLELSEELLELDKELDDDELLKEDKLLELNEELLELEEKLEEELEELKLLEEDELLKLELEEELEELTPQYEILISTLAQSLVPDDIVGITSQSKSFTSFQVQGVGASPSFVISL